MTAYLGSIDGDRASHRRNCAPRTWRRRGFGFKQEKKKPKSEKFVGSFTRLWFPDASEWLMLRAYFVECKNDNSDGCGNVAALTSQISNLEVEILKSTICKCCHKHVKGRMTNAEHTR